MSNCSLSIETAAENVEEQERRRLWQGLQLEQVFSNGAFS